MCPAKKIGIKNLKIKSSIPKALDDEWPSGTNIQSLTLILLDTAVQDEKSNNLIWQNNNSCMLRNINDPLQVATSPEGKEPTPQMEGFNITALTTVFIFFNSQNRGG